MKQQKVEEYLKERLLVNDKGVVDSTFDELVEVVKMLCKQKCEEQKVNCFVDYKNREIWMEDSDIEAITEAHNPIF